MNPILQANCAMQEATTTTNMIVASMRLRAIVFSVHSAQETYDVDEKHNNEIPSTLPMPIAHVKFEQTWKK